MATLAYAFIRDFEIVDGGLLNVHMKLHKGVSGWDGAEVLAETEMDPTLTSSQMNSAIIAWVKDYAETTWSLEFGLFDTVKLINPIDSLLGL